jgi:hypothetical protein
LAIFQVKVVLGVALGMVMRAVGEV